MESRQQPQVPVYREASRLGEPVSGTSRENEVWVMTDFYKQIVRAKEIKIWWQDQTNPPIVKQAQNDINELYGFLVDAWQTLSIEEYLNREKG